MAIELKVPDIGDFKDVEVIEILVSVGDSIQAEQSLVTVESDKSSMEIPASQGGVVKAVKVKIGDKVSEGTPLVEIEAAGEEGAADKEEQVPQAAAPAAQAAPKAAAAEQPAPQPASSAGQGAEQVVTVPDIGDFKDVEVIEVLVKAGDRVAAEQSLVTVESDKSSMEIPSSAAGEVLEVLVKARTLTVAELAERAGVPVDTAAALARTLVRHHLVLLK